MMAVTSSFGGFVGMWMMLDIQVVKEYSTQLFDLWSPALQAYFIAKRDDYKT